MYEIMLSYLVTGTFILGSCGVLINIHFVYRHLEVSGPTNKIYTYFGSGYVIDYIIGQ